METYFAPAKRTDRRKFQNQIFDISHSPIMNTLLEAMSGLIVLLNEDRQIVAVNHDFLKAAGVSDAEEALGLRLGESLNCVHAKKEPNGCGTTEFCSTCGAVIAMLAVIEKNQADERICVLSTEKDGFKNDICLLIKAQPIVIENNWWILMFAQDITQQQFRINMERVFFHDINNMLTSLLGNSELLYEELPDNEEVKQIKGISERLLNEIRIQKSLFEHKDLGYLLRKTTASINDIKRELAFIVNGHESLKGKYKDEIWPDENITITTDILLVSRILGNMVINALEATKKDGSIKLTTKVLPEYIRWDVWNEDVISQDTQKRIFQRHFSTKSNIGRGLGTFSMKLFGETLLKGSVSFKSSLDKGTTFVFKLPY